MSSGCPFGLASSRRVKFSKLVGVQPSSQLSTFDAASL
jgi:hypothetical protein